MNDKPSIDPQNFPLWIITCFALGLLALLLASITSYKLYTTTVITQAEVLMLNRKIEDLRKQTPAAPAPVAPSASNQSAK